MIAVKPLRVVSQLVPVKTFVISFLANFAPNEKEPVVNLLLSACDIKVEATCDEAVLSHALAAP